MNPADIIPVIIISVPIVSVLSCLVTVSLFSFEQVEEHDRRVARVLVYYLLGDLVSWVSALLYLSSPVAFAYVQVATYGALSLHGVLLYRVLFEVTRRRRAERFGRVHYVAPLLLTVVLGVWSALVPFEVQVDLARMGGRLYPGYEWYSQLYLSKTLSLVVFCIIYIVLGLIRFRRYRAGLSEAEHGEARFWMRWLFYLIGITVILMLLAGFAMAVPRHRFLKSWIMVASVLLIVYQQMMLASNIIGKNYGRLLQQHRPQLAREPIYTMARMYVVGPHMTPDDFDAWFETERIYLRADLKLSDVVEATGMNRNTLSAFVNRNFGMNFNAYVNTWRLRELEHLLADEQTAAEGVMRCVQRAGFGSYRSYLRVKNKQWK